MESETSKFENFELSLTSESKEYLFSAGKWAFFLGIVGFIFTAFILMAAIIVGIAFSNLNSNEFGSSPFGGFISGGFIAGIYIVLGVFYGILSYFLVHFGSKMKKAYQNNNTLTMTEGLKSLKLFFKIWGITTIVLVALYIVMIMTISIGGASIFR
ncbi:MAG: DUF5362 family protein [Flavobacteriaceae bacterium]